MDKIVVLDFGSQYSHLICRRIRDFSVYAELVPFDISLENLTKLNPKGIIFSGGPASPFTVSGMGSGKHWCTGNMACCSHHSAFPGGGGAGNQVGAGTPCVGGFGAGGLVKVTYQ